MTTTSQQIRVRNPRNGNFDYEFQSPSHSEISTKCAALRDSQPAWNDLGVLGRAEVLRRWADKVEAHADIIGDAEMIDTGRSRLPHEVPHLIVSAIRGWCNDAPGIFQGAELSGISTTTTTVSYSTQLDPIQLVGVISPWNQPFLLATLDAVPALIAGCSVIIKPSEVTPRFIAAVMETVNQVPGLSAVLQLVPGDGGTGQSIIANVDALCFTGSVATGKKVARACADRFIPAFLELGGKDPAIVTASADLGRAATAVLKGATWATGQICFSTERVYVDNAVIEPFVAELVRLAELTDFNYPDIEQGQLGPFIYPQQATIVDSQLKEAVDGGATILTGGYSEVLGGGLYMRPTVLVDVDHTMKLMREETFGPVIPIMGFDTIDEAVALANDSDFGLSAAVIAGTADEAEGIGRRLRAGAISLQDTSLTINIQRDVEKTSYNHSGLGGSRMGPNATLRFLRRQALIRRTGDAVDLHTFAGELGSKVSK